MSPRVVCALKKCRRWFVPTKANRKHCSDKCKNRAYYLSVTKRRRRRHRNRKPPVPLSTAGTRVYCRTYVEVGFARKALGLVAAKAQAEAMAERKTEWSDKWRELPTDQAAGEPDLFLVRVQERVAAD